MPAEARAVFNVRFNDRHSGADIERWLRARLDAAGGRYDLDLSVSGEAFLTPPGALSDLIGDAVETVLGRRPELSTTGGTSDARFIKDFCPVRSEEHKSELQSLMRNSYDVVCMKYTNTYKINTYSTK